MEYREYDHVGDFSLALYVEHLDHEGQHESGLTAHDHELGYHVGEKNFGGRHTGHPTTVQKSLHPLDDERGRGQRDRQEEDDSMNFDRLIEEEEESKHGWMVEKNCTNVKITPGATKSVKLGSLVP